MRIGHNVELVDNVWRAVVGIDIKLTPVEAEALDRFGTQVVDCGGTFTGEGELSFTLPTMDRRFPDQFPVQQLFSEDDYEDANARAIAFRDTIRTRLIAARDALLARDAGTAGSVTETV